VFHVTGVQTCALPISLDEHRVDDQQRRERAGSGDQAFLHRGLAVSDGTFASSSSSTALPCAITGSTSVGSGCQPANVIRSAAASSEARRVGTGGADRW